MEPLTYGRMDRVLESIGFSIHPLDPEAKVYQHGNGAGLTLPTNPDDEPVSPRHLGAVRAILIAFGMPEPAEFTRPTQRAG